jgi:acetyl esterase/lipase
MSRIVLGLLALLAPGILLANTYSFSVAELDNYIERSKSSGDMLSLLIGEKIEERLNEANITLNEGELLFDADLPDKKKKKCSSYYKLSRMHATVRLDSSSNFQFVLDKLSKPVTATADLSGDIDADGKIKLKAGVKVLGKCVRYYSDKGSFDYDAKFHMTLTLKVMLNPELDTSAGEHAIKITPVVTLDGDFISYAGDLDVHGLDNPFRNVLGPIGSILINTVKGYIEDKVSGISVGEINSYYHTILHEQQSQIQEDIQDALGGTSKTYVLPDISDDTLKQIGSLLHDTNGLLPVTFEFLKSNKREILYALLVGDRDRLKEIVGASLSCQASQALMTDMPVAPLPQSAPFQDTSYAQFCLNASGAEKLGNAEDSGMVPLDTWTLTPGNRFDIGVMSIEGNYQPYMQRVKYLEHDEVIDHYANDMEHYGAFMKSCMADPSIPNGYCVVVGHGRLKRGDFLTLPVYRGDGSCSLEMRVYKKDIAATGLKPLLAIHGGSWKYRGFGFFGLESQISHYTDQGFVVFAPFYRLVGDSDGNIECNGKVDWQEITADIESALDWVEANASRYGASGPVNVMGQSAGAHLAGWLATHRSDSINRALLVYPPTDLRDLIDEYNYGNYNNKSGISALAGFIGANLDSVDINSDAVFENTFPAMVSNHPDSYPDAFIMHGVADELVPSRQSVRLCNGYAGNVEGTAALNDGGDPSSGIYKRTYQCGDKAQLHLFAEAAHVLDVCVPGVACLAGGKQSQAAIRHSLDEGIHWLHGDTYTPWLVPILSTYLFD